MRRKFKKTLPNCPDRLSLCIDHGLSSLPSCWISLFAFLNESFIRSLQSFFIRSNMKGGCAAVWTRQSRYSRVFFREI